MDGINSHSINYNNINLLINIKSKKILLNEELIVLEVSKENGNSVCLGNFYVKNLPRILNYEVLEILSQRLIDNFDIIVFDKGRFIGNFIDNSFEEDDEISNQLSREINSIKNEELKQIYVEFKSMKKSSIEFRKYSYFLGLYFNSHQIPDLIRELYLRKKRKNYLYYHDLDSEIKKEFEDNITTSKENIDYQNNIELIEQIKIDMDPLINELSILESILDFVREIKLKLNNNKRIKEEVNEIDNIVINTGLFSKKRMELNKESRELKKKLIKININDERNKLKEIIELNFKNLIPAFDSTSLDNIELILEEKYESKNNEFNKFKEKYDSIYEQINYYEQNEIDISDLYDRVG